MENVRLTGTVRFFDNRKGYGFIGCDELPNDVFVHQSRTPYSGLYQDQIVTFVPVETAKGVSAQDVRDVQPRGIS